MKAVARGHTATVDAFLTPYLEAYISGFKSGFEDGIDEVDVSFMKSDGGYACSVSITNTSAYVPFRISPDSYLFSRDQQVEWLVTRKLLSQEEGKKEQETMSLSLVLTWYESEECTACNFDREALLLMFRVLKVKRINTLKKRSWMAFSSKRHN